MISTMAREEIENTGPASIIRRCGENTMSFNALHVLGDEKVGSLNTVNRDIGSDDVCHTI